MTRAIHRFCLAVIATAVAATLTACSQGALLSSEGSVGESATSSSGGVDPTAADDNTGSSEAACSIESVGEAPTTTTPGDEFPVVNVQVLDAASREPLPDRSVVFSVDSGPASWDGGLFETTTDDLGTASAFGLTAGTSAGDVTLHAVAAGCETRLRLSVTQ